MTKIYDIDPLPGLGAAIGGLDATYKALGGAQAATDEQMAAWQRRQLEGARNAWAPASSIPTEATARKALPVCTGFLDYFPDAALAVAELSRIGNEQHNPGQPLHWAKEKSTDEPDALVRHLLQRGTRDTDGVRHSAKVAWRAMALLQREIDAERAK